MVSRIQNGHILSKDGLKLFYRSLSGKKDSDFVVLAHGFAEHSGRYDHLFNELDKAHFNVLAFDFRGHGYSEGKQGRIDNLDQYLDDLKAAYTQARVLFGEKKGFLVAHSMGALVGTFFAEQYSSKLKGIVFSCPFFAIKVNIPKWKAVASAVLNSVFPDFSMPNEIAPEKLSHDSEMVAQYKNDPLIFHHATIRWFNEMQRGHLLIQNLARKVNTPLFIQLAGKDLIVDSNVAKEWFTNCHAQEKKLKTYEGFFHEIYNEKNREQPIGDMIAWLIQQSK